MTLNTTMELTRGELGMLLRGAMSEWERWEETAYEQEKAGWHDAKEKDRVLTYQHQSWELVKKLQDAINEMDGRNA